MSLQVSYPFAEDNHNTHNKSRVHPKILLIITSSIILDKRSWFSNMSKVPNLFESLCMSAISDEGY